MNGMKATWPVLALRLAATLWPGALGAEGGWASGLEDPARDRRNAHELEACLAASGGPRDCIGAAWLDCSGYAELCTNLELFAWVVLTQEALDGIGAIRPDLAPRFAESQALWEAHVRASCALAGDIFRPDTVMLRLEGARCRRDATADRAIALRGARTNLEAEGEGRLR